MRFTPRSDQDLMSVILTVSGAWGLALLSACGGGYGGGGGGSGGGNPCGGVYMACPPPTVSVSAPANNATVSGTVALTASATASTANNLTVASVDFLVDGASVGTAMAAPYTVMWNSTTVTNGSHTLTAKVTDSMSDTATSAAVTLNVQNMHAANAAMTPAQVFPTPHSSASGMAHINVKMQDGAIGGTVTLTGLSARGVTINRGFAGAHGEALIALTRAGEGSWRVPAGALLTAEELRAFTQGGLYVIATSAANPGGELRAQLLPAGVKVSFSALAPSAAERALGLAPQGVAATTVDSNGRTLTMHVNSSGVDDAIAAGVAGGSGAAPLAALVKDAVDMGHWSVELAPITAADATRFESGGWSVSVATPATPEGALAGAIEAPRAAASESVEPRTP